MEEKQNILRPGVSLISENLCDIRSSTKRFIIYVNDSSSESSSSASDDDDDNGAEEDDAEEEIASLPVPSFADSLPSKSSPSSSNISPVLSAKLQESVLVFSNKAREKEEQQATYLRLKEDFLRREQKGQQRMALKSKELRCRQIKLNLNRKRSQMIEMKTRIAQRKLELKKLQTRANKLHNLYRTAMMQVNQTCQELGDLNQNLKKVEKEINEDQQTAIGLEQECKMTGRQLDQNEYSSALLTTKRPFSPAEAIAVSPINIVTSITETMESTSNSPTGADNSPEALSERLLNEIFGNKKIDSPTITSDKLETLSNVSSSDLQPRPMSVSSVENMDISPAQSADDNSVSSPVENLKPELPSLPMETTKKTNQFIALSPGRPSLSKSKKDTLLRKVLQVERNNERSELEKSKKEEMLNKKLNDQRREREIVEIRASLKSKQLQNKLLIRLKEDLQTATHSFDTKDDQEYCLQCLSFFLKKANYNKFDHLKVQICGNILNKQPTRKQMTNKFETVSSNKSVSIVNSYQSVLEHLHAYRLSEVFERNLEKRKSDLSEVIHHQYSNCLNSSVPICNFDLNGTCNDDNCKFQHRNDYLLDENQRLLDLLLYRPSVTNFPDPVVNRKNADQLRTHLSCFLQSLQNENYTGNVLIKHLLSLIRSSCDGQVLQLTRCLGRATKHVNTFESLDLNLKIRDRANVLTNSKVKHQTPGIGTEAFDGCLPSKNRYYEEEATTLTNKLEQSLKSNSKDVDGWIRLAYLQLTNETPKSTRKSRFNNALIVLCKALDVNRDSAELWCSYLYLFMNRLNIKGSNNIERLDKHLHTIVRRVLFVFPCYEIWKAYISLCCNYLDKELLSSELLEEINQGRLLYYDQHNSRNFRSLSNCFLEVILFKVCLHLQIDQSKRAETFLADLLCSDLDDLISQSTYSSLSPVQIVEELLAQRSNQSTTFERFNETRVLIRQDKLFAWLCYLHLVCFGCLPFEKFALFGRSFSFDQSIIRNKRPFFIRFEVLKKPNFKNLLIILKQALIDCFLNVKSNPDEYVYSKDELFCLCQPLFQNLILLSDFMGQSADSQRIYEILQLHSPNLIALTVSKSLFEASKGMDEACLSSICDNNRYQECNLEIMYPICLMYYKLGKFAFLNFELAKIVRIFMHVPDKVPIHVAFQKLMLDKSSRTKPKTEFFQTVNAKLWVLYFISELVNGSDERIDSLFQNILSVCMVNREIEEYSLFTIHYLYLDVCAMKLQSQSDMNQFIERLKIACHQLNSHLLQYRLVKTFTEGFFKLNSKKFHFIENIFILQFENIYLLSELNVLSANEKELKHRLYTILRTIMQQKRCKGKLPVLYWKLLLLFSISTQNNLETHQFFQQALSNYPYNKTLWNYFLDYERSLEHSEHIKSIESTIKCLKLPQFV